MYKYSIANCNCALSDLAFTRAIGFVLGEIQHASSSVTCSRVNALEVLRLAALTTSHCHLPKPSLCLSATSMNAVVPYIGAERR